MNQNTTTLKKARRLQNTLRINQKPRENEITFCI